MPCKHLGEVAGRRIKLKCRSGNPNFASVHYCLHSDHKRSNDKFGVCIPSAKYLRAMERQLFYQCKKCEKYAKLF